MKKYQKNSDWRRRTKRILIEEHGSKCFDCGYTGPAFHFDFDHRDPAEKAFGVGGYGRGIEGLRAEASKCDLVCVLCHRTRTHIQRCDGCSECTGVGMQTGEASGL